MIFPTRHRENGHFEANPLTMAIFPMSRGKNHMSRGVENRGSLISAPLDIRVEGGFQKVPRTPPPLCESDPFGERPTHHSAVRAAEVGLAKEAAIMHATRSVKLHADHRFGSKGDLAHELHGARGAVPRHLHIECTVGTRIGNFLSSLRVRRSPSFPWLSVQDQGIVLVESVLRLAIPPVRQRSESWPRANKSKRSFRGRL